MMTAVPCALFINQAEPTRNETRRRRRRRRPPRPRPATATRRALYFCCHATPDTIHQHGARGGGGGNGARARAGCLVRGRVVFCGPNEQVGRAPALAARPPGTAGQVASGPKAGAVFTFLNVPHINNRPFAVENHSIICQMKTEPSSWTTAAASFYFFYLASARLAIST
jgi:hypothetical protein